MYYSDERCWTSVEFRWRRIIGYFVSDFAVAVLIFRFVNFKSCFVFDFGRSESYFRFVIWIWSFIKYYYFRLFGDCHSAFLIGFGYSMIWNCNSSNFHESWIILFTNHNKIRRSLQMLFKYASIKDVKISVGEVFKWKGWFYRRQMPSDRSDSSQL